MKARTIMMEIAVWIIGRSAPGSAGVNARGARGRRTMPRNSPNISRISRQSMLIVFIILIRI